MLRFGGNTRSAHIRHIGIVGVRARRTPPIARFVAAERVVVDFVAARLPSHTYADLAVLDRVIGSEVLYGNEYFHNRMMETARFARCRCNLNIRVACLKARFRCVHVTLTGAAAAEFAYEELEVGVFVPCSLARRIRSVRYVCRKVQARRLQRTV